MITVIISKQHLKTERGKRRIFEGVFCLIRGEAMDLQHYLLRLRPGMCSGRQNVFRAFRYKYVAKSDM